MGCSHSTPQMTDDTDDHQYFQMASCCTRQPQLSLVHCILCRWTWNTIYYIYHDFRFSCFPGMRLWALKKTAVCWMHNPGIKSNILPIKATSSCVMTDKSCGRFLPKLNSGSFRGKTANRKLQFTVTRLQFQNAGISNISKVLFFVKSKCIALISQKQE